MSLSHRQASGQPAAHRGPMPATVDPKPWMAVVGVIVLALGMVLGAFVHNLDPAKTGELAVLEWFKGYRNGTLTAIARALELIDGPKVVPWILVGMLLLFLVLRRYVMAFISVLLPGLGWLPGHFAKGLFPRARPPHSLDPVIIYRDNASFPSGHTGFATSIVIFILFALTMWGVRRWWADALGIIFVVVVALSRLYAAAHFPFDVIGGATLAGGTSMALWPAASWWWGRAQASGGRWAEPEYRRAVGSSTPPAGLPSGEASRDTDTTG